MWAVPLRALCGAVSRGIRRWAGGAGGGDVGGERRGDGVRREGGCGDGAEEGGGGKAALDDVSWGDMEKGQWSLDTPLRSLAHDFDF